MQLDDRSDIDHVLIGPGGIFVISTKSHRGRFESAERTEARAKPRFNGEPTDWCADVVRQAMRLKEQLVVVALPSTQQPWVQTVLSLPFAHIDQDTSVVGPTWVINEESLVASIEDRRGNGRLSSRVVKVWVDAVEKLANRHRKPEPD